MVYIPPAVALFIDTFATLMCQTGYLFQKKGHMSVEAHNSKERDPRDRKSGFFTCLWVTGFIVSASAGWLHAGKWRLDFPVWLIFPTELIGNFLNLAATPFADIVLLSFNSATAILFQVFLALCFLNEVLICRYDLPGLFLIISGSACIILTANFSDVESSVAIHK